MWTGVSIIMLLAGISAMAWWYASKRDASEELIAPDHDPLGRAVPADIALRRAP